MTTMTSVCQPDNSPDPPRQNRPRSPSLRFVAVAIAVAVLSIERLSDSSSKRFGCEGLVEKDDARFKDPVMDDGFIRVPGHVDHAERWPRVHREVHHDLLQLPAIGHHEDGLQAKALHDVSPRHDLSLVEMTLFQPGTNRPDFVDNILWWPGRTQGEFRFRRGLEMGGIHCAMT
jgi:hypothetical protein